MSLLLEIKNNSNSFINSDIMNNNSDNFKDNSKNILNHITQSNAHQLNNNYNPSFNSNSSTKDYTEDLNSIEHKISKVSFNHQNSQVTIGMQFVNKNNEYFLWKSFSMKVFIGADAQNGVLVELPDFEINPKSTCEKEIIVENTHLIYVEKERFKVSLQFKNSKEQRTNVEFYFIKEGQEITLVN